MQLGLPNQNMVVPKASIHVEQALESMETHTDRPILYSAHSNKVQSIDNKQDKCSVKEEVIEFQDMRSECTALSDVDIKTIQKKGECKKDCTICCMDNAIMCLLFELLLIMFVILAIKKKYLFFLGSAISGMILLFDLISSDMIYFLSKSKYASAEAIEKLNAMKSNFPKIVWMIQCYHIETTITKCRATQMLRMNTTSAKHIVKLKTVNDTTDYSILLGNMDKRNCMIYIEKSYTFDKIEDANNYEALKQYFIATNKKDVFYDFQEIYEIEGWKPKMLSMTDSKYNQLLSIPYFILFSLLGFSWLYRIINYAKSYKAHIQLNKAISI